MNQELMQRKADEHRELMRRRREKKRRRRQDRIGYFLLLVSVVFIGIFAMRVIPVHVDGGVSTEPTVVSFTEGHVQWLDQNYNESMENGFCLFGYVNGSEVVVQDVEFVDNPFSQSKHSMMASCVPQILARSGSLFLESRYRFVGFIHTHPEYAALSSNDRRTFAKFDSVLSVFGVYNGDRIAMYSAPNQSRPIHSVLRFN